MVQPERVVTLRPLTWPDADVMAGWAADRELCREAGWSQDLSFARARRFHQGIVRSPPAGLIRLGAVHDGRLVGYVDLHGEEVDRRELGFVIGERPRWGEGLGLRAASAGLREGFGRLDLREVWAETADANHRSVRVLQRLGMSETARGEGTTYRDEPTHFRRFVLTSRDWRRHPA